MSWSTRAGCTMYFLFDILGRYSSCNKTSEPFSRASTSGLSALQMVQNLNSNSNFDKKTMCFGSDLRFEPLSDNLERNKSHAGKTCGTQSLDTLTHKQMGTPVKKKGLDPIII